MAIKYVVYSVEKTSNDFCNVYVKVNSSFDARRFKYFDLVRRMVGLGEDIFTLLSGIVQERLEITTISGEVVDLDLETSNETLFVETRGIVGGREVLHTILYQRCVGNGLRNVELKGNTSGLVGTIDLLDRGEGAVGLQHKRGDQQDIGKGWRHDYREGGCSG